MFSLALANRRIRICCESLKISGSFPINLKDKPPKIEALGPTRFQRLIWAIDCAFREVFCTYGSRTIADFQKISKIWWWERRHDHPRMFYSYFNYKLIKLIKPDRFSFYVTQSVFHKIKPKIYKKKL